MKMTEKTKGRLAVWGGIAICAGLLTAICLRFTGTPAGEDGLPGKEETVTQAVIGPGQETAEPSEMPAIDAEVPELAIQPETGTKAGETQTAEPAESQTAGPAESQTARPLDSRPAQTGDPEQSIQPEVEKPGQPEEPALTNPGVKPDGEKVETPPEPVDHDAYVPPADNGGGNVGGGLPGFSNVPEGGPNTAIQAEGMYENGNKIGSMD